MRLVLIVPIKMHTEFKLHAPILAYKTQNILHSSTTNWSQMNPYDSKKLMILQIFKQVLFYFTAYVLKLCPVHQCAFFAAGNSCKLPNRNFIGMTYLEDNSWLHYKFPLFTYENWNMIFKEQSLSFALVKIYIWYESRLNFDDVQAFFCFCMPLNAKNNTLLF